MWHKLECESHKTRPTWNPNWLLGNKILSTQHQQQQRKSIKILIDWKTGQLEYFYLLLNGKIDTFS